MPPQLARAKRRNPKARGYVPRPLVEQLDCISANDLARRKMFPNSWHSKHRFPYATFRFPCLTSLIVSLAGIEATLTNGYTQLVAVRWIRTGFGGNQRQRPLFVCQCGCAVVKVAIAALPAVAATTQLTQAGFAAERSGQSYRPNASRPSSNSKPTCDSIIVSASKHALPQRQIWTSKATASRTTQSSSRKAITEQEANALALILFRREAYPRSISGEECQCAC